MIAESAGRRSGEHAGKAPGGVAQAAETVPLTSRRKPMPKSRSKKRVPVAARFQNIKVLNSKNVRALPQYDAYGVWREAAIFALEANKIITLHIWGEKHSIDPKRIVQAVHPWYVFKPPVFRAPW